MSIEVIPALIPDKSIIQWIIELSSQYSIAEFLSDKSIDGAESIVKLL